MEAELVRSAARARDVVESYRQYGLTVSRWQTRLLASSASIARIAAERPDPVAGRPEAGGVRLAQLAEALRDVARNGLRPERARLDRLGKELESLVSIRVPGYPRPEDPDRPTAVPARRGQAGPDELANGVMRYGPLPYHRGPFYCGNPAC
jgi:hypothetical protein